MSLPTISVAMRRGHLLALIFLFVARVSANAAEPADAQIKSALADIQKFEAQFAGNSSPNPATVNRTLKLLALTRERLDGSPNRDHASWIETDARLKTLVSRLQSFLAPAPASAPTADPAVAPPPQATSTNLAAPQMISQDRVRIQKLVRDVASAADTLARNGAKPFQGAEYVQEQVRVLEIFKASLAAYSDFSADADVIEAGAAIARFEQMIADGRAQAGASAAALGDVQARLRALDRQRQGAPAPPPAPDDAAAIAQWLAAVSATRQTAAAALEQLAAIRASAFLPIQPGTVGEGAPYDMQDVDRLEWAYRGNLTDADHAVAQWGENLDAQVTQLATVLDFVERLDPANESDQANAFLGAGAAANQRERLEAAQRLVTAAMAFDQQLGREQLTTHQQMHARVERTRADYETKHAQARALVRVPQAASTDQTLVAIARETLKNPSYGVGAIRRLVISADKVHHEKKTSETEFNKVEVGMGGTLTLSGTQTTYLYAWDQFQVATVEPVGAEFFIFYHTLKRFTSGAPTTPIDRWILAERMQGCEIPAANIDRD